MATTDLVTLAEVKEFLEIVNSEEDAALSTLIERATAIVERYTHRKLKSRVYTQELYNGSGKCELRVREWPVTAVAAIDLAIAEDPVSWESEDITTLIIDPYTLRTIRFRDGTIFPSGYHNIRLTCTAGYTPVPEDLKQGCLEVIAQKYRLKEKQMAGVESVSFQGQTTRFVTGPLLPETKMLLDPFVRRDFD